VAFAALPSVASVARIRKGMRHALADLPEFYHRRLAASATISRSRAMSGRIPVSVRECADQVSDDRFVRGIEGNHRSFSRCFPDRAKDGAAVHYLFPIYYQVATLRAEGAGTNYAVGGLYAWSAIVANRLTGDASYLDEARRAIQCCTPFPRNGCSTSLRIGLRRPRGAELGMQEQAKYLLYQQLRMFYWYSDPSQKAHDIREWSRPQVILYPLSKRTWKRFCRGPES